MDCERARAYQPKGKPAKRKMNVLRPRYPADLDHGGLLSNAHAPISFPRLPTLAYADLKRVSWHRLGTQLFATRCQFLGRAGMSERECSIKIKPRWDREVCVGMGCSGSRIGSACRTRRVRRRARADRRLVAASRLQRFASAAARQIINLPAGSIVGCALADAGLLFEASVTQFRLNIPRLFDGTRMAGGRRFMRDRKKREVAGLNRRAFVVLIPGAAIGFAGCTTRPAQQVYLGPTRQDVTYVTREKPGTIVVDPANHFLYLVEKGGQAVQYQVGVGKEGYGWSGIATVHDKQEWPDWYPTQDILDRKPEIRKYMVQLRSGYGMHGGPENPLGARALYLWQGKVDTLYRIHGTNEPESVGHDVSAGCIRMRNDDVTDLYDRTKVGTKVVVLTGHSV